MKNKKMKKKKKKKEEEIKNLNNVKLNLYKIY